MENLSTDSQASTVTLSPQEIEGKLGRFRLSTNFPRSIIFERHVLPVEENERQVTLVTSTPNDPYVASLLTYLLQKEIVWVAADEKTVIKLIKDHYGVGGDTLHEMLGQEEWKDSGKGDGAHEEYADETEASVIKFVNQVIHEAHRERATDIHFEPMENSLRIRYRVDGVLHQVPLSADAKRFENAIISRVKVMAGMDIAERRLPQDGRLQARVEGEELDVRVSTIPSVHGESVSLRLLTRQNLVIGLNNLGLCAANQENLKRLLCRPHGIILLTGPTGCGKSTTLYACLSEINREELRIITLEDPIEYKLAGVNQIQVRSDIGFDFAKGLRHILRQDPDVIMVGEIRDYETAEIAIRASLTGHLVLSTLHTNDAAGAVTRLLDMGVEPFLVSSSLNLVIAQRLVRKVCPHCARAEECPPVLSEEDVRFLQSRLQNVRFLRGTGCEHCSQFGYLGRTGIHEFMLMSEGIRPLILGRSSSSAIKTTAMQEGMLTLRQDGLLKAAQGITTVEEVLRVAEEGD